MKHFEYDVVPRNPFRGEGLKRRNHLIEQLNALSENGWEMVQLIDNEKYILVRRKIDPLD